MLNFAYRLHYYLQRLRAVYLVETADGGCWWHAFAGDFEEICEHVALGIDVRRCVIVPHNNSLKVGEPDMSYYHQGEGVIR